MLECWRKMQMGMHARVVHIGSSTERFQVPRTREDCRCRQLLPDNSFAITAMATTESSTSSLATSTDLLQTATHTLSLHTLQNAPGQTTLAEAQKPNTNAPPMITYTRPQILCLHNSPLVQPPANMPEFKDWFGSVSVTSIPHLFLTQFVH